MLTQSPKYNFLSNFLGTPRPQQIEALEKIDEAFSNGYKYVLACLPTGSGKSHIATAIASTAEEIDEKRKEIIESYKVYKRQGGSFTYEDEFNRGPKFGAFVLTVTRSLQDQYKSFFEQVPLGKGKNNYKCDVDNNFTVETAPCLYLPGLKESCFALNRCPYYKSRNEALISQYSVLNYRYLVNLPDFLRRREFYICDEASAIEDELVGQYSITLNYSFLQAEEVNFKKLIDDDSEAARTWATDVYSQLKDKLEDLKYKMSLMIKKGDTQTGVMAKTSQKIAKLSNIVSNIGDVVGMWNTCEYMIEKKDGDSVTFSPYNIKPLAYNIFAHADKILLMSATISNPKEFAKSLGIKEGEYVYIDIPSTFEAAKSPIICSERYNLSYKTMERDLPGVLDLIMGICEQHEGEKGIIHTHTHHITEQIKRKARNNRRFLFREAGISNEDIILEHKERETEDTILVSPSLDTGISLDGDLGRFQIIVKAPYLPLGSKRIKKIFDRNKEYYVMKMLDTLIQMGGRCTRSVEDHCTTYIIDGVAVRAIKDNARNLPKHFVERFI